MDVLIELVRASEKAANIARAIRNEEHLFKLLVQRKDPSEANARFGDDFKTLADVLIQEVLKHDIGLKFPEIQARIKGEESNVFCNQLGTEIIVEVKNTEEETAKLLETVLNGDGVAASLLSKQVHSTVSVQDCDTIKNIDDLVVDLNTVGIWIDPIDSTSEYINGRDEEDDRAIPVSGLHCVTVLIGVFDTKSGEPIIGVINQPFVTKTDDGWSGKCYWGISANGRNSIGSIEGPSGVICISGSEKTEIETKIRENGYEVIKAAGAGYKILLVIKGIAECYILSNDSTFKWDTCGAQAILKSMGGDIAIFRNAKNEIRSLSYLTEGNRCNCGGLIAYRNKESLKRIVNML